MKLILKAKREVSLGRAILTDHAKKKDGLYQYKKYVRKAGLTADKGLLLAVDVLLDNKERKGEDWYANELYKIDKKLRANFVTAHQILGKSMGLDKTQSVQIAKLGIETAEKIIGWVENRITNQTR